jgi:hypothetical protein
LRPTRSTITRLPSGSFASRSTSFRSGAFGVGDRYCPPLHGRVGGTSAHPHSAGDSSFGVVLRIHAHVRPHGLGRNTSHKPCDSPLHPSAQSRLSPESPAPECACRRRRSGCPTSEARSFREAKVARGRADAPRPPALYVGYPVSFEYGASLIACAYRWAMEVFKALLCTGRMGKHSKTMSIWHNRFWGAMTA